MVDQFNLADELRRGGTGLLAQAVASIWKVRFREQPHASSKNEENYARAWLEQMHLRESLVPAGNQAKAPTALDEMRALQEGAAAERHTPSVITQSTPSTLDIDDVDTGDWRVPTDEHAACKAQLREVCAVAKVHADVYLAQLAESREALARVEAAHALEKSRVAMMSEAADMRDDECEQLRIEVANLKADLGMYKNYLRVADVEIRRLGGK